MKGKSERKRKKERGRKNYKDERKSEMRKD